VWAPELIWKFWKRKKGLACTPQGLVTIPTTH
jgi:hypothetical protein